MPNEIMIKQLLIMAVVVVLQSSMAYAQEQENKIPLSDTEERVATPLGQAVDTSIPASAQALLLDNVVVTATANPMASMRSSVSVSILDPEEIRQAAPASAADILLNVPGLYTQASGGEGNANVTARGLPGSGGAKFMLFQEDGLPVLHFGDIDFATADTFLRNDYNVDRLEVIRGGSASTLASNAPAGVFNFISKTGEVEGGNIGVSRGVDFDQSRVDFDYGKPLGDGWRFHVGGFYRYGEGPRTVGYAAEDGGQVKGNITREFDNGFIRVNVKLLNDRAPVYLPVPISITGTNSSPHFSSFHDFDVLNGAMQSKYFRHDLSVNRDGNVVNTDIADGYYSNDRAFGIEAAFDLANGWKFNNKFRVAAISGRFVGPFPAEVKSASALASDIGGAGATLRYATGPQAGQTITNPDALNGNGMAVRTHLFNTTLNDMGNYANDLSLTKTIPSKDYGTTLLTFGYYKAQQRIDQDWHWNTYLLEVKGKNAALLDVVDSLGNVVTQHGLVAYGEPAWGNCCVRSYRLTYDTDAPYFALNWQKDAVNIDGSLRYDIAGGHGSYAGSTGTRAFDVNGDGILETPELTVPIVDPHSKRPVDYTVRYLSYSLGANYLLNPDLAVFGRVSEGGRANAERVLFGGGIKPTGRIAEEFAVNTVKQYEGGIKWRSQRASLFATLFHTTTSAVDQDITSTTTRFMNRVDEADGLELEGAYYLGNFSLRSGLTYTAGHVVKDEKTPKNTGDQVNPRYMLQLSPSYRWDKLEFGLNAIGVSKFPTIGGGMDIPGFIQVNAFATYEIEKGLRLSVTGNNILNKMGITEVQNASAGVPATGAGTARSINGRTINATLVYSF